jgi:hypothetical protein
VRDEGYWQGWLGKMGEFLVPSNNGSVDIYLFQALTDGWMVRGFSVGVFPVVG